MEGEVQCEIADGEKSCSTITTPKNYRLDYTQKSFEFSGLFYPTKGVGGKRYDPCVMQRRRCFGKGTVPFFLTIWLFFGIKFVRFLGGLLGELGVHLP